MGLGPFQLQKNRFEGAIAEDQLDAVQLENGLLRRRPVDE